MSPALVGIDVGSQRLLYWNRCQGRGSNGIVIEENKFKNRMTIGKDKKKPGKIRSAQPSCTTKLDSRSCRLTVTDEAETDEEWWHL
jgi:hypothetical protein